MTVIVVLLALLALAALWAVLTYNGLVRARNKVDEAWSGIDVQLKRRHDLVPNLVAAVKGYAEHEQRVFTDVAAARSRAMAAASPAARADAEAALSRALVPLNALAEQYPTLRAAENFQRLQAELAQLEDEIQAARRIYNSNVQRYRTSCEMFPNSLVASSGGFTSRDLFQLDSPLERAVPQVAF